MGINLTPISEILTGVVTILPALVDFVVNLLPVSIAIMICGFIGAIFAKIIQGL
jgi:hypothetical protein